MAICLAFGVCRESEMDECGRDEMVIIVASPSISLVRV